MNDSYIQQLFADRIGGPNYGKSNQIYKFAKIKQAKRAAMAAKPTVPLIDLGVGEPDDKAPAPAIAKLAEAASKLENRIYADNGGPIFRTAAARWMERVCGVPGLNPDLHILPTIGSKSALAMLPGCFINPGDVALMTTPGYPVFGNHTKNLGGHVHALPLTAANQFLPDLNAIPSAVLAKAKVLVLNYPNNPTGASATPAFFAKAVDFCRKHKLILVHDSAYASLVFEGKPMSILSIPGASEVAIELHSMSKAFNMTGWRLGWACGNELILKAFGDYKDGTDSGQFLAIQEAAAHALDNPQWTADIAKKYSRRMDLLVPVLRKHGFTASKPQASFFLYVASPKAAVGDGGQRTVFDKAEDFSQWLIGQQLISTVPWDDAGAFIRWSVTFTAPTPDEEKAVIAEIDRRLSSVKLEF
jgi:LL-diaminopimelate aminotransferase